MQVPLSIFLALLGVVTTLFGFLAWAVRQKVGKDAFGMLKGEVEKKANADVVTVSMDGLKESIADLKEAVANGVRKMEEVDNKSHEILGELRKINGKR